MSESFFVSPLRQFKTCQWAVRRFLLAATFLACAAVQFPAHADDSDIPAAITEAATAAETQPTVVRLKQSSLSRMRDKATRLTFHAFGLLGIPYVYGGNDPERGLDCSGFIRVVFQEAIGANLPRTAIELSKVGKKIPVKELQPGDLVFFNTLRRGFSHVGLYVGNSKFIHAPSTGGAIRVESMDGKYWKTRYNGGRRIVDNSL